MKVSGQHIEIGLGHFCVGPKPRGGEWLGADLRALKREGFTLVASLLTVEETTDLDLVDEATLCKENGLDFYSFPIVDRSTPRNRKDFEDFATRLLERLKAGDRGFFHCRAGLGRAPLLGCTIMLRNGAEADKAWKMLADVRGQMVPDTEAQRAWIKAVQESVTSLDDALSKLRENGF